MVWELGQGWGVRPLGQYAPENSVQIIPSERLNEKFNYWGLDAIEKQQFKEPRPNFVSGSEVKSTCVAFGPQHVLYCKLRPYLNKVIVPTISGIGSTEWVVLKPNPAILERNYSAYVLRTKRFIDYASTNSTGARMPRARKAAIKVANIPLPYPDDPARSLAEQRRIVARIEALFAELRECRRLHEAVVADTDRLMDSVRHEVFSGLAISSPAKKFDEIAESRLGKMLSKAAKNGEDMRPYLRNANVQWDEFRLDDLFEMNFPTTEQEKYRVEIGDLLICEGGEIGRTSVWNGEVEEIYFQKALHRARLRDPNAPPRYLMHFMAWAAKNGAIARLMTGAAIPHLTGVKLKTLDVIWPDRIIDLHKVATFLDSAQLEVSEMQSTNDNDRMLLEQMEQAILAQAFRGEL